MGRDSDRLVDNNDVVVVMNDSHAGNEFGDDHDRRRWFGQFDLEPAASRDSARFSYRLAIDPDQSGRGKVGGLGAREAKESSQRSVNTLTLKAFRYF